MSHPQDGIHQYAQGDLLFTYLGPAGTVAVPKGKSLPLTGERFLLALGEATGHHHSVAVTALREIVQPEEGVMYLTIDQLTSVEHQEHGSTPLDRLGVWKARVKQREASDADEGWGWTGD